MQCKFGILHDCLINCGLHWQVDVGLRLSVDVGTLQYMAPPSSGLFYAKTLLPFVIVSILFFVVVTICAIKRYKLSCR